MYDVVRTLIDHTSYIIHINRATGTLFGRYVRQLYCGFVVLMEPFPFGDGFLLLGLPPYSEPGKRAEISLIITLNWFGV
jgi:hypothetical protein